MKLEEEFQKALQEIGPIIPWWFEADQMFVFEHPLYPAVMHADPSMEETILGYHGALRGFIEERIQGTVADFVDKMTSGRGGARAGSGRPKSDPTRQVRLPIDIADWLKQDPAHLKQIRKLMHG